MPTFLKRISAIFLCLGIVGCVSIPTGFLKPNEGYLQKRELQMRQYDTTDQEKIITSVAGVLQDLSFTLDASETQVGFVAASKKADATNAGQVFLVALLGGANAVQQCDKSQVIKASVITKSTSDGKKTVVRVTFQRIVWNMAGQINRVETLSDPAMYQKFYDSLSKAIFLEAQKI
ncbi:MAG: hypothetical protein PHC29_00690 [Candidatus Omnitrophica bacterium]|nr:hypothetical protein [Candidatus Omnitrophota bacterium]